MPLADPDTDVMDRILGRAAVDPVYRSRLLGAPAQTLAGEALPHGMRRALAPLAGLAIGEFARCALEIMREMMDRPPRDDVPDAPERTVSRLGVVV